MDNIQQEVLDQTNLLLEKLYPLMEQYTVTTLKIQQCIIKGLHHLEPNPVHELYDFRDLIKKQMEEIIDNHIPIKTT